MSAFRLVHASALAAALMVPGVAMAAGDGWIHPDAMSLSPAAQTAAPTDAQTDAGSKTSVATAPDGNSSDPQIVYVDAPAETPNVHGFVEFPFKPMYVTPRGLVVENSGLVMQPVAGLVFPIGDAGPVTGVTFVTGVWNSINTNQDDHFVGPWNELDYFASLSGNIGKFSVTATYSPWFSPVHAFAVEETADVKVAYDDTGLIAPGFAIKPYVDFFYSISGDSTVILGRKGSTYYFELGIVPSYTYKVMENYPLTFTLPTYVSVGPENYWTAGGGNGNAGVFSIGGNVSVPLAFVPVKYGFWHADAGVVYYYLINNSLLAAGDIASGNNNRNVVNASIGVGVNF